MKHKNINFSLSIVFIWIGFVCAISFMEAWLKFQAPGVTTALGLGIGQLVFDALNKVEITCALFIGFSLIFSKHDNKISGTSYFFIPLLILIVQTLWLLPELDHRAEAIILGIDLPKNNLHLWYVLLELVKVTSLFIYGIQLFAMDENR